MDTRDRERYNRHKTGPENLSNLYGNRSRFTVIGSRLKTVNCEPTTLNGYSIWRSGGVAVVLGDGLAF